MPEFLSLSLPEPGLDRWLQSLPADRRPAVEHVPTEGALGRVLANDVQAPHPLPPFARSTVDGYAVRAADTFGASPSLPAYLHVIGEVRMGEEPALRIEVGQAALIHTGGTVPPGSDAVVMLEDTQTMSEGEVEVLRPCGVGENILQQGEDVQENEIVITAGCRLRPQEIGGLMALGITQVPVAARPRVGILSSGDEIVPPDQELGPAQVRDVNSYSLGALVAQLGGEPILRGIISDNFEALAAAARISHEEDDLVVITAGSSVSARDITSEVIASLGEPGILVHGLAIKPGKPTILAVADAKPVVGLPGNPVSALVAGRLVLTPTMRYLLGVSQEDWQPQIKARLSTNVASETGRQDYQPVRLQRREGQLLAEPVYGRSNLIFTLVRADGLILIPPEATGLPAGQEVDVFLF